MFCVHTSQRYSFVALWTELIRVQQELACVQGQKTSIYLPQVHQP